MASTPELTTRDVFAQIDRRLTRLEDDLRDLRRHVEERFSALDAKIDRTSRWQLGITLAAWLSIMTTLLLR